VTAGREQRAHNQRDDRITNRLIGVWKRVWIEMTMPSEESHRFHDEASGNSWIDLPEAAIANSSRDVAGHALE
jgi:hypothetical protein